MSEVLLRMNLISEGWRVANTLLIFRSAPVLWNYMLPSLMFALEKVRDMHLGKLVSAVSQWSILLMEWSLTDLCV